MKIPDSGMPEESYWNSLFDIPRIVKWLGLNSVGDPVVEIGCGYGTFTVPVARASRAGVHAFDIENAMIASARERAHSAGSHTVQFHLRDVLKDGTGLESGTCGLVLLFNILHFTERRTMLAEAARILMRGGRIAIIHWRKDIETPRGPALDLRPDQQTIMEAAAGLDLFMYGSSTVLEPYHWGMQLIKGMLT